ncbi:hypothetical protein AURDEDRAFT_115752 [Auricularia subglabra TFB-10046 SS5]|uniref:Clavaminate synthase-like protein n=1 Tax=Auricularia subglabra (strain TFB-10046 / SS5) TaxID=717982 RepID=J0WY95_AURST|nr:hypothetical protein AURDEDRAFT_115752 [Auricularia subglabra TFB-10046 SS5]
MSKERKILTDEQVAHFLENGWIRIEKAFTPEQAAEWTSTLWARLGMDPADKSTWKERTHMPWHKREHVAGFAPKAWDAMCDLLGGEERIDPMFADWGDSFIVNLGTPEWAQMYEAASKTKSVTKGEDMMNPADLDNWHVDGDFFVHFLDSPEQALLVIPIYAPIESLSGGTYICPTAIPHMAEYLAAHSEGVVPTGGGFASVESPLLTWGPKLAKHELPPGVPKNPHDEPIYNSPAPWPPAPHPERFAYCDVSKTPNMRFTELTGDVGDVILMHPLMLHSASRNWRRAVRVITNPPVGLKEPFCFDRSNGDYSLVEKKTLMALGAWDETTNTGRLAWNVTGERRRLVPRRLMTYGQMEVAEKARIAEWKNKVSTDSVLAGPAPAVSSTATIPAKA